MRHLLLRLTVILLALPSSQCRFCEPKGVAAFPPLPLLPIPTASQLQWQRREVIMFFHFGMNTFTDSEWGTGTESPALFDPKSLDVGQWLDVAKGAAGVSLAILVAKHHDGFCLWPSQYSKYSVKMSPWRGGEGDVIREFVDAGRARGVDVGLYLSPWDRHEKSYGHEREYNQYYLAQLRELLGRYGGNIKEIWFDGAKGANATNMTYHFQEWFQTTKQMQTSINIFSDAGPDIRWVGNEAGYAGETCWSTVNRTMLRIGDASLQSYLNAGDEMGTEWVPPECDVSIRDGWFWHKNQKPKPLRQLLDIYYKSVGRNCVLLLNVPPNSEGLVPDSDIRTLQEFRRALGSIFSDNLAEQSVITASSERGPAFAAVNLVHERKRWSYWAPDGRVVGEHWIEMRWRGEGVELNVVGVEEAVWMGQRVSGHEVYLDGRLVANGTTVGYKRLHRLRKKVRARVARIRFVGWRGGEGPLVAGVGVYLDPYWNGVWGTYKQYRHPV